VRDTRRVDSIAGKGEILAKLVGLMVLLLPLALSSQAQNGENGEKIGAAPAPVHSIVPLPPSKALSSAALAGKKLFVQRCSVCHLPALPSYSAYGPLLDRKLVASRGEAAIRERILHGSSRMPGWQYTLQPAEIDEIIGYLQTLSFTQNE
jgi:mono/diheme cytochrome c family protein